MRVRGRPPRRASRRVTPCSALRACARLGPPNAVLGRRRGKPGCMMKRPDGCLGCQRGRPARRMGDPRALPAFSYVRCRSSFFRLGLGIRRWLRARRRWRTWIRRRKCALHRGGRRACGMGAQLRIFVSTRALRRPAGSAKRPQARPSHTDIEAGSVRALVPPIGGIPQKPKTPRIVPESRRVAEMASASSLRRGVRTNEKGHGRQETPEVAQWVVATLLFELAENLCLNERVEREPWRQAA